MTTIYFNFTNHQKWHLIEFLKKYFEIFLYQFANKLSVKVKGLHSGRTKSIGTLALKFGK